MASRLIDRQTSHPDGPDVEQSPASPFRTSNAVAVSPEERGNTGTVCHKSHSESSVFHLPPQLPSLPSSDESVALVSISGRTTELDFAAVPASEHPVSFRVPVSAHRDSAHLATAHAASDALHAPVHRDSAHLATAHAASAEEHAPVHPDSARVRDPARHASAHPASGHILDFTIPVEASTQAKEPPPHSRDTPAATAATARAAAAAYDVAAARATRTGNMIDADAAARAPLVARSTAEDARLARFATEQSGHQADIIDLNGSETEATRDGTAVPFGYDMTILDVTDLTAADFFDIIAQDHVTDDPVVLCGKIIKRSTASEILDSGYPNPIRSRQKRNRRFPDQLIDNPFASLCESQPRRIQRRIVINSERQILREEMARRRGTIMANVISGSGIDNTHEQQIERQRVASRNMLRKKVKTRAIAFSQSRRKCTDHVIKQFQRDIDELLDDNYGSLLDRHVHAMSSLLQRCEERERIRREEREKLIAIAMQGMVSVTGIHEPAEIRNLQERIDATPLSDINTLEVLVGQLQQLLADRLNANSPGCDRQEGSHDGIASSDESVQSFDFRRRHVRIPRMSTGGPGPTRQTATRGYSTAHNMDEVPLIDLTTPTGPSNIPLSRLQPVTTIHNDADISFVEDYNFHGAGNGLARGVVARPTELGNRYTHEWSRRLLTRTFSDSDGDEDVDKIRSRRGKSYSNRQHSSTERSGRVPTRVSTPRGVNANPLGGRSGRNDGHVVGNNMTANDSSARRDSASVLCGGRGLNLANRGRGSVVGRGRGRGRDGPWQRRATASNVVPDFASEKGMPYMLAILQMMEADAWKMFQPKKKGENHEGLATWFERNTPIMFGRDGDSNILSEFNEFGYKHMQTKFGNGLRALASTMSQGAHSSEDGGGTEDLSELQKLVQTVLDLKEDTKATTGKRAKIQRQNTEVQRSNTGHQRPIGDANLPLLDQFAQPEEFSASEDLNPMPFREATRRFAPPVLTPHGRCY